MSLQLKNITIGYEIPLIRNIETTLELGEVCLIIGNNGVGKTTLIKSILNQIPLISGKIEINGNNISDFNHKEIAEQITVVFSKAQIPINYTVEDLIALGKYIHYPYYFKLNDEDKYEVNSLIKKLNLEPYKKLYLQKLSDGNLQKAFIGRALAQNSPIIILDEPTTHLDEENKIIILKLLRIIAKEQNKLILFSSHDWRLAKEFADKIWYIENQKLYADLAEDLILKQSNLSRSTLFNLNNEFKSPEIDAPTLEKEMIFSTLHKKFNQDLSSHKILFKNNKFIVNNEITCDNIKEILFFFKNKL